MCIALYFTVPPENCWDCEGITDTLRELTLRSSHCNYPQRIVVSGLRIAIVYSMPDLQLIPDLPLGLSGCLSRPALYNPGISFSASP